MSHDIEEPEEGRPKSYIHEARHDRAVKPVHASAPNADLTRARIMCCKSILDSLASGQAQFKAMLMNEQEFPVIVAPLISNGIQASYRKQLEKGISPDETWLGRALVDMGKILEHWYGNKADAIRYAKATQLAHRAGENERTLIDQFPQIAHSEGREWQRAGAGLCQTAGGALGVWFHWPQAVSREDAIMQLRQDHDALVDALDHGLLQMVDAAEHFGHGCGALGYGRA